MIPVSVIERVGEASSDKIEKTDDDGVVQIYSYKHCDSSSPTELMKFRGLVFAGDRLVLRSFGFTPEYTDVSQIQSTFSDYTFFPSEEGTLLRVFHVTENDKWYVATHRKLDAFQSKWGSAASFGDLFLDALQEVYPSVPRTEQLAHLTAKLDRTQAYFFLVRNTADNRIVCHPAEKPEVYHVGSLLQNDEFDVWSRIDDQFPKQAQLSHQSWEDVATHIQSLDPLRHQGVIGFTRTGAEIKVLHPKNQQYATVRGNDSNLLYRYVRVRTEPENLKLFLELYPEKYSEFLKAEQLLTYTAMNLHLAYVNRFVRKQFVKVPADEFRIVKVCHEHYLRNRGTNRVTLSTVVEIMARPEMAPTLFAILKRLTALKNVEEEEDDHDEQTEEVPIVN